MSLGSNGNIFIFVSGMIILYIIQLVIPFLLGFFIVFFILSPFFSNKKSKFYVKTKSTRLITVIVISILFGYLTFLLFQDFFYQISSFIIKKLTW